LSGLPALRRITLYSNADLTSVTISSSQPLGEGGDTLDFSACGLTEAAVDGILVALSENGVSNGNVNLAGGTNAAPSADTGASAQSVLEANGWSVSTN
jgi:hypothetical protein